MACRLEADRLHGRVGTASPEATSSRCRMASPRAITPDGVSLPEGEPSGTTTPFLAGSATDGRSIPFEGGEPQPVPALTARDIPLQWSDEGRFVYTVDRLERTPDSSGST